MIDLNAAFRDLGADVSIAYIGEESGEWHCDLKVPLDRYTVSLVTASGATPEAAVRAVCSRATTFARKEEGRAA